ncbi:MAG TPA: hypothetical protein VM123_00595 [archaeon]|nr:hypothetical protein [archaeon]
MNCALCGEVEVAFNFFTRKRQPVKVPEDTRRIVCSRCVQILLVQPKEELERCYQLALQKGFPEKAAAIKSFFKGEEDRVPKTKYSRSRLGRKRFMRKTRPAGK